MKLTSFLSVTLVLVLTTINLYPADDFGKEHAAAKKASRRRAVRTFTPQEANQRTAQAFAFMIAEQTEKVNARDAAEKAEEASQKKEDAKEGIEV